MWIIKNKCIHVFNRQDEWAEAVKKEGWGEVYCYSRLQRLNITSRIKLVYYLASLPLLLGSCCIPRAMPVVALAAPAPLISQICTQL